ncbi:MAG: hypothetical protein II844_10635 [Prevotella sp.]|nr:hypothetical protein [Prevotella sp.]
MTKRKTILQMFLLCCLGASAQTAATQGADGISYAVKLKAAEEAMAVRLTYNMRREAIPSLERFMLQRERWKEKCDSLYPNNLQLRVKYKVRIDRIYRDSVNTCIIPSLTNKVSGENVSKALYWQQPLHLDTAQYHTIMEAALDMARRIYDNPHVDVWEDDIKTITTVLDEKQQRRYFHFKNALAVTHDMDNSWKRLADAGLTEQLDSVAAMNQAFDYYHELYRIKDIYRNHGQQRRKATAELDKHKPQMLKMLDALDKQSRMDEEEKKTPTVGKEFVW